MEHLTKKEIQKNKDDYIALFEQVIIPQYPKAQELLDWIKTTDFFIAPASAKYHSAFEGGLCLHSLLVYDRMLENVESYKKYYDKFSLEENLGTTDAGIALISLCHDLCKIQTYEEYWQNVKEYSENGKLSDNVGAFDWVQKRAYKYNEKLNLGHGSKSLYILMKYVQDLSTAEVSAIYHHMGGMGEGEKGFADGASKYPLVLMLHIADIEATFWDEQYGEL